MVNAYLVLAYGLVWALFMAYAWVLAKRQGRLKRELEELKTRLARGNPGLASPSESPRGSGLPHP